MWWKIQWDKTYLKNMTVCRFTEARCTYCAALCRRFMCEHRSCCRERSALADGSEMTPMLAARSLHVHKHEIVENYK